MARLHASFSERSLKSEVSSPVLAAGGQVATPVDGEGLLIGLAIHPKQRPSRPVLSPPPPVRRMIVR